MSTITEAVYTPLPHLEMPEHPTKKVHKAASSTLMERNSNGDITVIMLKILKVDGSAGARYDSSFAFPGGKIAKAEDGEEQALREKNNPLLTAARELHEECEFAFPKVVDAWNFLNQETTKVCTNIGWEYFPVVQYSCALSQQLSAQFDKAINNSYNNREVEKVTRVPLKNIVQAFENQGWTLQSMEQRAALIKEAKNQGKEADLSYYKHLDADLLVEDASGEKVNIAPYIARSLFNGELKAIQNLACQLFPN